MKRWIVITTMIYGMLTVRGSAAERQNAPAAKPHVELEIRLIERPRDKETGFKGTTVGMAMTPAETKNYIADLTANPQIKVLAAPRLVTEVGQKATFRSGGEYPRKSIKPRAGEIPTQVYDFVGTALDATVSVSASGSLMVNLLFEQSERNQTNNKDAEPLNQRRLESVMELRNGQTCMLGFEGVRNIATEKRPLVLSDVPDIGDTPLSNQRTAPQPVELILLVTATLVEEPQR